MTADEVTTATEHIGWVEFVTADDAATTHVAYVHEDGSVYLPEGPVVVSGETFRLAAATDRFWPLVRAANRPAPQVDEGDEHHHDIEAHAASFVEGFEAAVAQGLASSPEFSSEWLAERDREVASGALREAADAEFSGNVGDTWDGLHPHDVLTARADRIARGEGDRA